MASHWEVHKHIPAGPWVRAEATGDFQFKQHAETICRSRNKNSIYEHRVVEVEDREAAREEPVLPPPPRVPDGGVPRREQDRAGVNNVPPAPAPTIAPRLVANEQNLAKGVALGVAGRERATAGANEEWKRAAYAAGLAVARRSRQVTTDMIWQLLTDETGKEWHPQNDSRAMGGVMTLLRNNKIIRESGRTVQTKRKSAHGAPIRVYESLLFGT